MAHKVNPKVFRIKRITDWVSRGFYKNNFSENLREDFEIRKFLNIKLSGAAVEKIEIERFAEKINIIITSARPGLIIGRGGEGIESLKKLLGKYLKSKKILLNKKEIRIEIREIKNHWSSAKLLADSIAQQLEKRISFRRAVRQVIDKVIIGKEIQGMRVEVSGRLDGATMARKELFNKGRMPRQTIRAEIDFARVGARCSYGVIGIKVWLYKGEKFEEKEKDNKL